MTLKWHLHVTVQPHWSWTLQDVASALQRDVERHGVRPLVITNHFRDNARPPYKELIPTCHHDGDEASAARRIFNLGVLLNNAGWRVKRLKIEGDPSHDSVRCRALYFETHLKNPVLTGPVSVPRSTNAKGDVFYTIRRPYWSDINNVVAQWTTTKLLVDADNYHVEAAVLDTNPQLDHDWINQ